MSDIAVRFGFVESETNEREPAFGIYPAKPGKRPMYAIPLSSAYKYTDARYLAEASFKVAEFFGMFPDQFLISRISDTILNNLETLVRAKPATHQKGQAFGEGKVMIDGDEVDRFEVYTGGGLEK